MKFTTGDDAGKMMLETLKIAVGRETNLGELNKLGIHVSKHTVQRYMRQAHRDLPPHRTGQTWDTFLENYAREIWACRKSQAHDL